MNWFVKNMLGFTLLGVIFINYNYKTGLTKLSDNTKPDQLLKSLQKHSNNNQNDKFNQKPNLSMDPQERIYKKQKSLSLTQFNKKLESIEFQLSQLGYPHSIIHKHLGKKEEKYLIHLSVEKEKIKNAIHNLKMEKIKELEI